MTTWRTLIYVCLIYHRKIESLICHHTQGCEPLTVQTFLESGKYSQRLHTMSIETMIKWTEQKSLNTGFDMFLNDDICYSLYWCLHQVNTLYQPDIKDLMPGILIAWCDGALNAVMVEMVMMIILSCLWLLCCCCWWISWAWWCPWWWFNEHNVDLPSCDQGGGKNQKT